MIALVPSAADVERLAVPGGESADELHLTLIYLGPDATVFDPTAREVFHGMLSATVAGLGPVDGDGFAISAFNPGSDSEPETCIVLGVAGAALGVIHDEVSSVAVELANLFAIALPVQHEPWIPHVTLEYTDDLSVVQSLAGRVGPIQFDRLRLAFGGQITDISLGLSGRSGADEFTDDEATDALLAALERIAPKGAYARAWESGKHPRIPRGGPGGGRFLSLVDHLQDHINGHLDGTHDRDPFEGYGRESLRRVAKARGVELQRGASRDEISQALLDDIRRGRPIGHRRAHGEDLVELDATGLGHYINQNSGRYHTADPGLSAVAARQGFDGRPRVVSKQEMDDLVHSGGHIELFRGVAAGHTKSARQINEDLRSGDAYFGTGIFGNGYYFAAGREPAGFYSDETPGSVIRAALPKDARIIDYGEINTNYTGKPGSSNPFYSDPGRWAAARGHDAIRKKRGAAIGGDYYVILNRSALVVEEDTR
jgi:hypothetical protein